MVIVNIDGNEVHCYGDIEEDSNFECYFDNELIDCIVTDMPYAMFGDDWDGKPNMTWNRVAQHMQDYAQRHCTTIEQISAC
jgi:hypothetical protein